MESLIEKYNRPVPRYTSYPTVPFWDQQPMDKGRWLQEVKSTFQQTNADQGIGLYLHLPFCESLCTYCGCNKRITRNHQVENPYIESLLQEWQTYLDVFQEPPQIRELHLGGGTPTFFRPKNLELLIGQLLAETKLREDCDLGFEGHPNNTSKDHLRVLYDLGFRRLSLGVQDFDPKVQQAINRIQSFEQVRQVTDWARAIGYESVNFDLIYGLPFQTIQSMLRTIDQVGQLGPDRIAYYSYAHVPWKSPSQRGYSEKDLPEDQQKRQLYELGKSKLADLGYVDIGMDHFASTTDPLCQAYHNRKLHRNFMGYTVSQTKLLIGLGVSAISETPAAYAQNDKQVESYQQKINARGLAVFRGHFLSKIDQRTRSVILKLICNGRAPWDPLVMDNMHPDSLESLKTMQKEQLVELGSGMIKVTELGRVFIRNICSTFDAYLEGNQQNGQQLFSKAI